MISPQQIAWLAGILEGEGYFQAKPFIAIGLQMTDKDVMARAAELMGSYSALKRWKSGKHIGKHIYTTRIHGPLAAGIMMTIWGFMGERRRERIRSALEIWRAKEPHPKHRELCFKGHPLTPVPAHRRPGRLRRWCRECYNSYHKEYESKQRFARSMRKNVLASKSQEQLFR